MSYSDKIDLIFLNVFVHLLIRVSYLLVIIIFNSKSILSMTNFLWEVYQWMNNFVGSKENYTVK